MTVTDLEDLYDYSYWANARLLTVVAQLTPEEFTRPVAGSYGSVRNTLVHALSAEWGWLDRCGGPARGPKLNPDDYPTAASIVDTWRQVEASVRTFLAGLSEAELAREVEFALGGPTHRLKVSELMHHAAIHGVHHRGQAALLLRALGHAPGNVDILFYHAEKAGALTP